MCLDYSNTPDFLPGREVTGYVPDLESEMVPPEQGWQKGMDTEGPCYQHLRFYCTGMSYTWKKQLCPGQ